MSHLLGIDWYDATWGGYVPPKKRKRTMSKSNGSVFEIRPGVYAYGTPGERASAVVERFKGGGDWTGVRGVKPIIGLGAKQGNAPQAAIDKLASLGA